MPSLSSYFWGLFPPVTLSMHTSDLAEFLPQNGLMPPAQDRTLDEKWEKMILTSKGIKWQASHKCHSH